MYDSHHRLILIPGDQTSLLRAKFKFYPWCLTRNVRWIWKSSHYKNWVFSNHCLSCLVQCIFMKLTTFVEWSFHVFPNKSTRSCFNSFGYTVMQSLKIGKTRKSGLVPTLRQKNFADLFLVLPDRLKTWSKLFIRIPSLNFPEMRSSSTFWWILCNGYHGKDDHYKNFDFSFSYIFPSVQSFITTKWQQKKLSIIKSKFSNF